MDIILSNSSDKPIYEQIEEQIRNKIIAGELKQGELLPSIRALSKDLRISVITTKRAYDDLEKEGYIETVAGKGSFVANINHAFVKEEQLNQMQAYLQKAVDIANISKISKKEIYEIIDILMEEEKEWNQF